MADPQKRFRDEKIGQHDSAGSDPDGLTAGSKRQKVEPVPDPSDDSSAMFTALDQDLSYPYSLTSPAAPEADTEAETVGCHSAAAGVDEDEGWKLSVLRYLLEASDDELGIPNNSTDGNNSEILGGGENFPLALGDYGVWEFEDDARNCYAVLLSEPLM